VNAHDLARALHDSDALGCSSLLAPGWRHSPEHIVNEDLPIAEEAMEHLAASESQQKAEDAA
jgi:hypothetical protein